MPFALAYMMKVVTLTEVGMPIIRIVVWEVGSRNTYLERYLD